MNERLGLTDKELFWLQNHEGKDAKADELISIYQMVVRCPNDPGARGIFSAMLDEWRSSGEYGSLVAPK